VHNSDPQSRGFSRVEHGNSIKPADSPFCENQAGPGDAANWLIAFREISGLMSSARAIQ
jgi:hypothetical protein